jgi:hypothetical protein
LRAELVVRTPRGRKLTSAGYTHLGASPAEAVERAGQMELFS